MSKSQSRGEERSALHTHYKCFPTRGEEKTSSARPAADGGGGEGGKRADKGRGRGRSRGRNIHRECGCCDLLRRSRLLFRNER